MSGCNLDVPEVIHPTLADLIDRLPPEWREPVELLTINAHSLQWLLARSDDEIERSLLSRLIHKPGAEDFVLQRLRALDKAEDRRWLIQFFPHAAPWLEHRGVVSTLADIVEFDPDDGVALAAMTAATRLETQRLKSRIERRINRRLATRPTAEDMVSLESAGQAWAALLEGQRLPGFLWRTPPVFDVPARGDPLRFLVFGDFGTGRELQAETSATMRTFVTQRPISFALAIGDNFYPRGIDTPDSDRWRTDLSDHYAALNAPLYACLGNHDLMEPDGAAAELIHAQTSALWNLPSPYYSFTSGPVQFFALESSMTSAAQWRWLDEAISASEARWKVVFTHIPPYCVTGDIWWTHETLVRELGPILKNRVDAYFAGHHHSLQHLVTDDFPPIFISGGGGARPYLIEKPFDPRARFAESINGFAWVEATHTELSVGFARSDGAIVHQTVLTKDS